MKLSKRLETVASMVTKGNRAADVGCDHGFVPIFLVESGISPLAVAADVRPGPLSRAKEHIKEHRLEEKIQTSFKELILSPQSELFDVRRYLVSNGYLIEYEHMLCDEGKYYFIFHVLVKKDEREWSEEEYRYGKDICKDDMKTFLAYLEKEERQYEQILEKMKQAPENDRAAQRIAQLHQDITCLKKRRQLVYDCGCFA